MSNLIYFEQFKLVRYRNNLYKEIKEIHEELLKDEGVKLPSFKSRKALVLLYAYHVILNHDGEPIISKPTFEEVISKTNGSDRKDCQEARHLSSQNGWNIQKRKDDNDLIKRGHYLVGDLTKPYEGFFPDKRINNLDVTDWESLKKRFDYCCATCGSAEGQNNKKDGGKITRLQKGHIDPRKALTLDNTIPQCEYCNSLYKDEAIFDAKGSVKAMRDSNGVFVGGWI